MEIYRERIYYVTAIFLCIIFFSSSKTRADIIYEWSYADTQSYGHMELDDYAWDDGTLDGGELNAFTFGFGSTEWTLTDISPSFVTLKTDGVGQISDGVWFAMDGIPGQWSYTAISMTWMDNFEIATGAGVWTTEAQSQEPVPEPSTVILMGIGMLGLVGGAARKKFKIKRARNG